jgi:ribosomal protein L15
MIRLDYIQRRLHHRRQLLTHRGSAGQQKRHTLKLIKEKGQELPVWKLFPTREEMIKLIERGFMEQLAQQELRK